MHQLTVDDCNNILRALHHIKSGLRRRSKLGEKTQQMVARLARLVEQSASFAPLVELNLLPPDLVSSAFSSSNTSAPSTQCDLLRLVNWNVRGLDERLIDTLLAFDAHVLIITETMTPSDGRSLSLPGYVLFDSPRIRIAEQGQASVNDKPSGGVCIYVLDSLAPFVSVHSRTLCGDVMWLRLDLPGLLKPLFLCGAYITSTHKLMGYPDVKTRKKLFEESFPLPPYRSGQLLLVGGDFNARVGPMRMDPDCPNSGLVPPRACLDKETNRSGVWLTELVEPGPIIAFRASRTAILNAERDMLLFNGRVLGDVPAQFTRGSSTLDFFFGSREILGAAEQLEIKKLKTRPALSDHHPVLLDLSVVSLV